MRRVGWWLLLVGSVSLALQAVAQPAEIEPPHPVGRTDVAYPQGAHGGALVVLELTIDADGAVRDVRAIQGEEPFASAAAAAAQRWQFRPAEQAGRARAARIRFEVRFTEPSPEPQPAEAAAPAAKPERARVAPAPPPPPPPIVVDVLGEKQHPTAKTLRRAEVRQLPGAFGDPFRAIEALPGVTPIVSGVPYFFVRGAPPGNVGYFLDGIRVPYLYHLGLGPSVVHPGMVERVDLYPGAYPARYGRFAGGIVAGETMAPEPEFHGEAQVRLIDSGAMVEAPFAGRRGTALVGGRYSYTALVISLVAPEVELSYWDYQGRVSYELGPRDSVEVFSFGASDFLAEEQDGESQIVFATEFHRIDLRHTHEPSARTRVRTALTLGLDRTRSENGFGVMDRTLSVRNEIRHRVSPSVVWRGGADAVVDNYTLVAPKLPAGQVRDQESEDFARLFPERTDLASGVWTDVVLEPEPGVTITPGVRLDYYSSLHATAVGIDPRIAASFAITDKFRLLHALGIAQQPPSFVIPIPGFQVGGLRGGLQQSLQASSGFELDLPSDLALSVTAFDNVFLNMTDPIGTLQDTSGDDLALIERRALGSTLGLEVMLRRPLTRKLGGFLSYTLSRSIRMFQREQFPATFDRTHVLNLVLGYDLGRHWRAGSRFVFYTGFPRFEVLGRVRQGEPARVPAFWRIDLRLEKRWLLGGRKWWAFVFEVMNATLNREVIDIDCNESGCRDDAIGPVTIPSIGLEAAF